MGLSRFFGALLIAISLLGGNLARASKESTGDELASAEQGATGGAKNPLTIDPDLAIFTGIVFVALMFVLGKFAWGPICAGLEKREHGIAEQIEAAEEANKEAHELLAQYEKKLAAAQDEVRAMIEQARQDGEANKQSILADARAGAEGEKMRAVRDIELATDKALKDLAERSANLAVELAGKIVQAKLSSADHSKLIQDAVAKFPQVTPSRN